MDYKIEGSCLSPKCTKKTSRLEFDRPNLEVWVYSRKLVNAFVKFDINTLLENGVELGLIVHMTYCTYVSMF